MDNQKSNLTEEELRLIEETERFMEEVNRDSNVANAPVPSSLRDKVYKEIRAREAERAIRAIDAELAKAGVPLEEDEEWDEEENADVEETFSTEDKELIRLGRIYKKRRKMYRYLVLAAALVFVVAFGVTSMGGPKKVFEAFELFSMDRNQTQINSDDGVEVVETIKEDEVYEQIETQFGFYPVKPIYRPEGVELLEASMGDEIQGILLIYGKDGKTSMSYFIRPNYRSGSYGTDTEDKVIEEYNFQIDDQVIVVKQYGMEEEDITRWTGQFSYKDVDYFITGMDMEKAEFEKILKNLFFS